MGCVYRQRGTGKSKNWLIKYIDRHGKTVTESSKSDDKKIANGLLRTRESEVEQGIQVAAGRHWRFDDAAEDILTDYENNERKSIGNLRIRIRKHLLPYFGGRILTTITSDEISAFTKQRRQAGASNAEINRELAAIKRMFKLSVRAKRIAAIPYIAMLAERNVRTGFFEREQFEAVRKHLPKWLHGPVTFAYLTGWRMQSEVFPLQWPHVDLDAGTVCLEVGSTKNGEGRTFPFRQLPELAAVIDEQVRQRDALRSEGRICPWVFHKDGGSLLDDAPYTETWGPKAIPEYRLAWKAACVAAGCPGRIPHDFRRTAVRALERAGVSRSVAMKLTGHKTEAVYRRYAIVSENDLAQGVEKLAQAGAAPSRHRRRRT